MDIRFKLSHDMHAALVAVADADGITISKFCEQVISKEVRRFEQASLLFLSKSETATDRNAT